MSPLPHAALNRCANGELRSSRSATWPRGPGYITSVANTGEAASEVISVVLADDHAVVRSALRLMLEREPDIEVVAEAGDADSAGR